LGLCDRIAVMSGGRMVETLARQEATQEKLLELALGHAARKQVPA
jgi:ABC-type sugar transport system ATPase subunit